MFLRLQTAPNQQLRGIYNAMFVDFVFLTLLEPMLAPCEHIRTEERSLYISSIQLSGISSAGGRIYACTGSSIATYMYVAGLSRLQRQR